MNRYVIYHFDDTSKIDNNDPKNIMEIISAANNYYKFNLQDMIFQQSKVVIAATSLTNTNNESALSRLHIPRTQTKRLAGYFSGRLINSRRIDSGSSSKLIIRLDYFKLLIILC